MIYQEVNFNQFCDSFGIRAYNNFSYEGKRVLFDWLESTGEDVELDTIALCCDYEELDYQGIINAYDIDIGDLSIEDDEQEVAVIVREYLEENTTVIGEVAGGFVFANF